MGSAPAGAVEPRPRFDPGTDREYQMLIDGQRVGAVSGATFACVDPFDQRQWGRVPLASAADVDLAVMAARRAFDDGRWSGLPPSARAKCLLKLSDLITEHGDELARTQVHENGKVITELTNNIRGVADFARFCGGLAEVVHGYEIQTGRPNTTTYTTREPVGVVAAVTPWNSPLSILGWKLFPALAAGCTVVAKPSELTPISTLRLAELCSEAGVPDGVVNVVTGTGEAASALVNHAAVDMIAFTGSTATGRLVGHAAAEKICRVSLELGGKSPSILFADADLDNATYGILAGIFAAGGQTCVAGSRVLVPRTMQDEVASRLADAAGQLRIGDPLDPSVDYGPLACQPHLEKVLSYVEIGLAEGATLVGGGHRMDDAPFRDGLFVAPTVFKDVSNRSRLAQEEVFGPVVAIIPFDSEDEAVALGNDTDFGLAASVWTRDVDIAHRMVRRLRAGTVWVNTSRVLSHALPFGGVRSSGIGRELGINAVHEYTQEKTVWFDTGNQQLFGRPSVTS